ncbi:MAG TPA: cytochrome c [Roseiarcus sp.]|nr:cytochrome c [Roseiarcus sp.]
MNPRPALLLLAMALGLAACDNMANQRKRMPYEMPYGAEAANWPAQPPDGVVARDEKPVAPPPVTMALLKRGQERFGIYCTPCHSLLGDGDGMIVHRGFPRPPSYSIQRLRDAPAQHFYDVITHGYGVMFPYAARIAPADRWAIVAYIRALQASTDGRLADVPADQRGSLQ